MSKPLTAVPTATTDKKVLTVFQKLLLVQGEIGTLEKQGQTNLGGGAGYKYAREVDFIHAIKPLFQKYQLAFYLLETVPAKVDHLVVKDKDGNEKMKTLTTVLTTYVLKNTEEGAGDSDHIIIKSSGQGVDNGDKGIYKAITGAKKYALQNLTMTPTGDDPEKDDTEETKSYNAKPLNKTSPNGKATTASTSDF